MEAVLTGEPLSAERAYQLGLVSRLVEPGQAEAAAIALGEQICQNAPLAVWASRSVVAAASEGHDDDTMWALTNAAAAKVMGSEDLKEGLAAFAEKRAPQWTGR
jgi:enoyl-CoA hydratase